ncbi:hypothetical protein [Psychromonas sp. Urea-02u-13]|uniref:COG3904 family protein n=1 Tax=Psychromonas sp. Urea-02u-13 TaxID=2058326 RepID=UPI000C321B07|nr:hypothetical protein [Psychromonas sp. Urea-02u-13]PKG37651.1 hypothetical protein CXF74_17705 [Psychromonas sp. Urea-02u-13]
MNLVSNIVNNVGSNIVNDIPYRKGLLAAIVSLTLVGCGSSNNESVKPIQPTAPTNPTTTTKPTIGTELQNKLTLAFPRSTTVFGIEIRGSANTSIEAIQHAAKILAGYLDNDQDGHADNEGLVAKLVENDATLIMASTESEMQKITEQYLSAKLLENAALEDLYVNEMFPKGSDSSVESRSESKVESRNFDATLEEILHLINQFGYAKQYPDVFAAKVDSSVADAMDIARGGRFETVPAKYSDSAWFTYEDASCDYACMVGEYTYWALTSILGAQAFEGRFDEIKDEWKLNTKEKVQAIDPAIYNILTNANYGLPSQLPDGSYDAIKFKVNGVTLDTKKNQVFAYISEQNFQNIAVYGTHGVEKAAYDRAVEDIAEVLGSLNAEVKLGLLNAGVKMLVVEDEGTLDKHIEYLMTLLPLEAVFSNDGGTDETLENDNGLSSTKLELMYLIVYYSLLTEADLSEQYQQLQSAYTEAVDNGLFVPAEAYQDDYVDAVHQNASDKNTLKYGSYLFNLANIYFGNDVAVAGEFTITTVAQLEANNPLGFAFVEALFDAGNDTGGQTPATFTFKDGDSSKVYMNGVINSNTLKDINKLLADHPQLKTLVLQDVPGSMDDEINLLASKVIRQHGLATHIPADGMVASGGTDMFLAGVERTIEAGAKIGVHAWAGGDKQATDYPKDHDEHKGYLKYYQEMGIPQAFYWFTIAAAPAESIHWMSEAEMRLYSMLTN